MILNAQEVRKIINDRKEEILTKQRFLDNNLLLEISECLCKSDNGKTGYTEESLNEYIIDQLIRSGFTLGKPYFDNDLKDGLLYIEISCNLLENDKERK